MVKAQFHRMQGLAVQLHRQFATTAVGGIAQQRVASPADIDLGVRLGLGYPMGPLAMGDALGPRRVLGILEQMLAITGDPRCRPSPWLRRRALLGLSLLSTD